MKIRKTKSTFSEINVTPFIDIMLVLLIIFMIVAKISQNTFNIELPKSMQKSNEIVNEIRISYNEKGEYFFNKEIINFATLSQKLKEFNTKTPVILEIYRLANYEILINLMDVLKSCEFQNISLLSESNES